MDVAEDVVFGTGAGYFQKKLLAAHISVQVAVGRAMGDEEVGVGRNAEAPVHPMSIGESKDLMAFVLDKHYLRRIQDIPSLVEYSILLLAGLILISSLP